MRSASPYRVPADRPRTVEVVVAPAPVAPPFAGDSETELAVAAACEKFRGTLPDGSTGAIVFAAITVVLLVVFLAIARS